MDIEQLKLILETVGTATDGVRDFAIAWLAIEAAKYVLGYAVGAACLVATYKIMMRLIGALRENMFAKEIRNLVCPELPYGEITDREKREIMEVVKAGMERKK
jgi:hypothetical protein